MLITKGQRLDNFTWLEQINKTVAPDRHFLCTHDAVAKSMNHTFKPRHSIAAHVSPQTSYLSSVASMSGCLPQHWMVMRPQSCAILKAGRSSPKLQMLHLRYIWLQAFIELMDHCNLSDKLTGIDRRLMMTWEHRSSFVNDLSCQITRSQTAVLL